MSLRFCGKCSAVARLEVVSCSGQCRRFFHRACVGLSEANFTTWTEDDGNGMLWFCTECRTELAGKVTEASGGCSLLPQEVLAQILRHLSCADLLGIRQVCRRWRDVVDTTPALFGRLKIFIRQGSMDGEYEPRNLIPAGNAEIRRSTIFVVIHWWHSLGVRLVQLDLDGCRIDFSTFHQLLGETPVLERLRIRYSFLVGEVEKIKKSDHRLTKLKEIASVNLNSDGLRELSRALGVAKFAQLKMYKFSQYRVYYDDNLDRCYLDSFAIMRSAQSTLQELEILSNNRSMFQKLCNTGLHLKRLCLLAGNIYLWDYDFWLNFFQTQSNTLEDLEIQSTMTEAALSSIGQACPNLKRLTTTVCMYLEPARFLGYMSQLRYLKLAATGLNLNNRSNSDLEQLILLGGTRCFGISEYLSKSPNIKQVRLESCSVDDSENFLPAIERYHETLEHLTLCLDEINFAALHTITKTFQKLTDLCIGVDNYPKEALLNILAFCPQLEVVQFKNVQSLDDEVILALLLKAKRLRELAVTRCPKVTNTSVMYVYFYASNLKQLRIDTSEIPAQLLTQLTKDRRIAVINSIGW